jgi:hypothetical protein
MPRPTPRLHFNDGYGAARCKGNNVRLIITDAEVAIHDCVTAVRQILRSGAFASGSDFSARPGCARQFHGIERTNTSCGFRKSMPNGSAY